MTTARQFYEQQPDLSVIPPQKDRKTGPLCMTCPVKTFKSQGCPMYFITYSHTY